MTRDQLEQQAEQNRAAVAGTLQELNNRLSPGEIVDQVLDYMKDGGGEFIGNLGKQVTANPMPVTLIGAGLAWFLFARNSANGNGSHAAAPKYSGNGQSMGSMGSSAAHKIGDAAAKAGDMATSAAEGVSSSVQAVGDAVSGGASAAYHQAADGLSAVKNSAMQVEERAMAAAKSAIAFCRDEPLVLAGVGLALGAAIGAALPHTDFEDELLGETSDEMKEAAKELAVDQLDKAKSIGGKLGDALQSDGAEREPSDNQTGQDNYSSNRPVTGFH